jgi:Tfp pilus assembly protein PilN
VRPINLLPAKYQPARATGERSGIGYAAIGALAVVLVMVLLYVVTSNGINDANEKKAQAEQETAVARARIGQLQAFGDFQTLKVSRENAVKSIAQVRFDYERLMREIALVLPDDTYLTQFASSPAGVGGAEGTVAATGPTVTIGGCSPTHPDVATTIVRLRKLHNIVDVNLSQSNKQASGAGADGAVCDVNWTGTLVFEAESAPTVQERVPARLGGGQ